MLLFSGTLLQLVLHMTYIFLLRHFSFKAVADLVVYGHAACPLSAILFL